MKRSPLEVVSLRGSPLDIAFELGKRRKRKIEERIETWNRALLSLYRGRQQERKRLESLFYSEAEAQASPYVTEIRAMAEGARVPFNDLFRLNLTELNAYADKCTTLTLPLRTSSGRAVLLAHNEDWDPRRNDVFVLKVTGPQVSYVIVAYDGYLPGLSCGINSFGLCHAINYLRPRHLRVGLPRIFITRHLVTAPNFDSILKWIRKTHRAFGQGIHLAYRSRYLGLELTARKTFVLSSSLPTVHTNHYLSPQLSKETPATDGSSQQRLRRTQELIKGSLWGQDIPTRGMPRQSAEIVARRILSDRESRPFAIWREADSPLDRGATVAMALIGTDQNGMKIFRKRPDRSKPLSVSLG